MAASLTAPISFPLSDVVLRLTFWVNFDSRVAEHEDQAFGKILSKERREGKYRSL